MAGTITFVLTPTQGDEPKLFMGIKGVGAAYAWHISIVEANHNHKHRKDGTFCVIFIFIWFSFFYPSHLSTYPDNLPPTYLPTQYTNSHDSHS